MAKARKSENREKLINDIVESMTSHELFSDNVIRKDTEVAIQKALFLRLEKGGSLKKILTENNRARNLDKAQEMALKNFAYEHDRNTTVSQFISFGTSHRPDAVLELDDMRIGIEIKKGQNGSAIRSGLGQCVLYSAEYDFVIYLFVDQTPGLNIKSSMHGDKEQDIVNRLWKDNNVRFVVV